MHGKEHRRCKTKHGGWQSLSGEFFLDIFIQYLKKYTPKFLSVAYSDFLLSLQINFSKVKK